MEKTYSNSFYNNRHSNTIYSAQTVCKLVKDLIEPNSVVDIGCGVGTWLRVFQDSGVEEVFGVEGEWVDKSMAVIAQEDFMKTNLENQLTLERKFDLAISLEVAEHIHEHAADQFVENIVNLAPVVLFSAAIPLQGGKHHVNEQWPVYWREKFAQHNYVIIDCIRPHIWEDTKVEMWYAQNTFIYADKNKLDEYPKLKANYVENPMMLEVVLPRFYEFKLKRWPFMKALKNRVKRAMNIPY
ncbi:MAG: class I SAM-dependent methyltransferase [Flammeovirgaceae bacterium]